MTRETVRKELLLGDEAIALGAINAGLSGVYAYPGTPSTEITEFIQAQVAARGLDIHTRWSANEKTAMEAALGMSFAGKRALVCMKHVGMNVCADAFVNSAFTGANGGLVVVAADDPSMHSSQNEQDSRFYGNFAFIPTFEPSSQQQAYDMTVAAFDFSEKYQIPVLMRLTTRMAHSRAVVEAAAEPREQNSLRCPEQTRQWVLMPGNSRVRYGAVLEGWAEYEKAAESSPFNRYVDAPDKTMGIIACGIAYNYIMENYPASEGGCPFPLLKLSQYPLPTALVGRMVAECGSILVVEDGQPVVEEMLRGVLKTPIPIKGRLSGDLPRMGELTPDNVRPALGLPPRETLAKSDTVVARPPALCVGCGHRDVFNALNEVLKTEYKGADGKTIARVFSDIGCYSLSWLAPFHAIDTVVEMGASITMAKGAADAGLHPAVAVIGDSTFTHSGMTGLLDAVNENSNITVVISDNLTTGMTGGQDSAGTGRLEQICAGIGVAPEHIRVVVPLPKNMEQIKEMIRQEIAYNGVSVIIPRRECIQTLKRHNAQAAKK
jgi:indolepyruvate ferredoxin oxidoreductase alpha subunit